MKKPAKTFTRKMDNGKERKFKSAKARDTFNRIAEATEHGFKPTGKGKGKGA